MDNERERFREIDVKMSKEIIATIKKEEGEYRNAKMKRRNIFRIKAQQATFYFQRYSLVYSNSFNTRCIKLRIERFYLSISIDRQGRINQRTGEENRRDSLTTHPLVSVHCPPPQRVARRSCSSYPPNTRFVFRSSSSRAFNLFLKCASPPHPDTIISSEDQRT